MNKMDKLRIYLQAKIKAGCFLFVIKWFLFKTKALCFLLVHSNIFRSNCRKFEIRALKRFVCSPAQ